MQTHFFLTLDIDILSTNATKRSPNTFCTTMSDNERLCHLIVIITIDFIIIYIILVSAIRDL